MNVEELFWNWVNYSYLVQAGVFANVWLTQVAGSMF